MVFGSEDSNLTNTLQKERVFPYTITQKHLKLLLLYMHVELKKI